jgi:hypothetical protein
MKREPRLKLRRTWFIRMLIAGAVFILVAAATLALQLSHVPLTPAAKLAELLLSLPFFLWLARAMPTGNSPLLMPWVHVITMLAAIPLALCAWRFHHHRERFNDEQRARELQDI